MVRRYRSLTVYGYCPALSVSAAASLFVIPPYRHQAFSLTHLQLHRMCFPPVTLFRPFLLSPRFVSFIKQPGFECGAVERALEGIPLDGDAIVAFFDQVIYEWF